ncbi:hypothetical protein BH18ACI5_BH18ACI5_20930 [soil metagenome]
MTSVAKAGWRRRFLFPVWLRAALISTVLLWNFGLTALEKRRMESGATVASSAPAAPLVASSTLLSDVKLLSDPSLEGRLTGSQGNHRAQALILELADRDTALPSELSAQARVPGSTLERIFLDITENRNVT